MKQQETHRGPIFIAALLVAMLAQACSPVHTVTDLTAFGACSDIVEAEFKSGYHPFLVNRCSSCHVSGGMGNGAFADEDQKLAFHAFWAKGEAKIKNYALDESHQSGFTGPENETTIHPLSEKWQGKVVEFNVCADNIGGNEDENNENRGPRSLFGPIILPQNLGEPPEDYDTLSFDLSAKVTGVSLEVEIHQFESGNGQLYYELHNPTLVTAEEPIRIFDIGFEFNGVLWEMKKPWQKVDVKVPANSSRVVGTGGLLLLLEEGQVFSTEDQLALSLQTVEVTTIEVGDDDDDEDEDEDEDEPVPVTLTQLMANDGVFGRYCVSCHSPAGGNRGGLNMNNFNSLRARVVPNNADASEIVVRMTDANAPMPTSGLLPQEEVDKVRSWINEGAQNN